MPEQGLADETRTTKHLIMAHVREYMAIRSMQARSLIEGRLIADACGVTPEVCLKCRWNCAYPSKRRNVLDSFLALFLLRPFRCRSCHRRYYRLLFSLGAFRPRRTPVKDSLTAAVVRD